MVCILLELELYKECSVRISFSNGGVLTLIANRDEAKRKQKKQNFT